MPALPQCLPTEVVLAASVAARAAHDHSGCLRSRRGVAIWQPGDGHLTLGTNKPASGACDGSDACKRVCGRVCVHAEQEALLRAGEKARGGEMLHVKVNEHGLQVASGPPSCPECSKLILHAGIAGMWLLHANGWTRYTAQEFHEATLKNCGLTQE